MDVPSMTIRFKGLLPHIKLHTASNPTLYILNENAATGRRTSPKPFSREREKNKKKKMKTAIYVLFAHARLAREGSILSLFFLFIREE
jgi:hypothetical protein